MTAVSISVGEEMNPTRRNTMEDSHVVLSPGTWNSPDPNMTYISVHDGHGGTKRVLLMLLLLVSFVVLRDCVLFTNDYSSTHRPRYCKFSGRDSSP